MSVTDAEILRPATHLAHVAEQVAGAAAHLVRTEFGLANAIGTKSTPTDVVTATDLASETFIRRELAARCPGSSIVGEEYDDRVGANDVGWIVDPIDGTVNFLYGLPVVSVSIAATLGGVVVAGAVADVRSGTLYSAERGAGARRDGEKIGVAHPDSLATALVGTGFSYDSHVRAAQVSVLTRLLPACRDIRCMGSAALNLCWVAEGALDGYFERDIKLYDYAAGALIAAEAGAVVELPDADAADPSEVTFASSPEVFAELRGIVG